jgi:HCOMODA/2-hydroxy-3-carboxy-muconic semialdehyde decarboxylase
MQTRVSVLVGALFIAVASAAAQSPGEAAITDLVLANRILASADLQVLGVYGHVSYRSRTNPAHFFIARNVAPKIVTAADVYESDLDGKPVGASRQDMYPERFIDAEIYRARPDVMAIVVAETPEIVAFSVSPVPLHGDNPPPVIDIRRFNGNQNGLVTTPAVGRLLAEAVGRRNTALLMGRGAVVVGTTINGVVGAANGLRDNARTQLVARSLGGSVAYLDFKPRPRSNAPQRGAQPAAGGRGAGGRGGGAADPGNADRAWSYWKFLANTQLAREGRALKPQAAAAVNLNSDKALIDDLVLANRILSDPELGVLSAFGHVSARSRANPNHYFISTDKSPGSVTSADMIENDLDSRPAVPTDKSQYQERFIHGEIYKAHPEVMAILHAHTPELIAFGQSSVTLRPVLLGASFIGKGLPIYDIRKYTEGYPSPVGCAHCISTAELGKALVEVIGNEGASLLLGHGIAVVDSSIPALVSRAYNMRLNAMIQRMALSLGPTVNYLDPPQGATRIANTADWDYWKWMILNK